MSKQNACPTARISKFLYYGIPFVFCLLLVAVFLIFQYYYFGKLEHTSQSIKTGNHTIVLSIGAERVKNSDKLQISCSELERLNQHIQKNNDDVENAINTSREEIGKNIDKVTMWISIWIGIIGMLCTIIPLALNWTASMEIEKLEKSFSDKIDDFHNRLLKAENTFESNEKLSQLKDIEFIITYCKGDSAKRNSLLSPIFKGITDIVASWDNDINSVKVASIIRYFTLNSIFGVTKLQLNVDERNFSEILSAVKSGFETFLESTDYNREVCYKNLKTALQQTVSFLSVDNK